MPRKARMFFKLTYIYAFMKFVLFNKLYGINRESVTTEHDFKA